MNKQLILKITFIIVVLALAIFVAWIFFIGFAIIVMPPYGSTEAETLLNMKKFCVKNGLLNFFYSIIISILIFVISKKYIYKNLKISFLLLIIFLAVTNLGNFVGIKNYYLGLQEEFKYHHFQK